MDAAQTTTKGKAVRLLKLIGTVALMVVSDGALPALTEKQ